MKTRLGLSLVALGVALAALSPADTGAPFGARAAYAGNGGDNGGGGGGGGGNGGGNGNGNGGGNGGGGHGNGNAGGSGRSARADATRGPKPSRAAPAEVVVVETVPALPGHGAIAAELQGLNAVHASPRALANAAPNSQVGRIAAYRDAALATLAAGETLSAADLGRTEAEAGLAAAQSQLDTLEQGYAGRSSTEIEEDIAALDPTAADYQSQVEALEAEHSEALAHEEAVATAEAEVAAGEVAVAEAEAAVAEATEAVATADAIEEAALDTAAGGRTLSAEAVAYVRDQLGL